MGLLHPHMEKLPSWWNDRGCFTPGHTHTSLLLWQEGVSTASGFGNQGLMTNWPLFLDRIHSAQVKTHGTLCSLPRDNGNITERKWAQTAAMCRDESWCRTGGFRRVWTQKIVVPCEDHPTSLTWSYSDAPGYRGQPRNSSAMTQPRDHMSMASQNGKPRMISGALLREKETKGQSQIFYSVSCISSL